MDRRQRGRSDPGPVPMIEGSGSASGYRVRGPHARPALRAGAVVKWRWALPGRNSARKKFSSCVNDPVPPGRENAKARGLGVGGDALAGAGRICSTLWAAAGTCPLWARSERNTNSGASGVRVSVAPLLRFGLL